MKETMMTGTANDRSAAMLWTILLTAASTGTTLVLACMTPFAALAAIAATRMSRREGMTLMIVAWAASQAIGFGLLGYPHDAKTITWGVGLGGAAVASVLAASTIDQGRVQGQGQGQGGGQGGRGRAAWLRVALAYVAASIAFKAVILLCSLGLGGTAISLSPSLFARQFVRDGAILVGLLALYRVLVSLGLPALARPARPALA